MTLHITPVPQTAPISDMRRRQDEILAMAQEAPVLLMSRSQPAGVLISVEQWDAMAIELRNARLLAEAKRIEAKTANEDWVSHDEMERLMEERAGYFANKSPEEMARVGD